jgi:hypothetical protein
MMNKDYNKILRKKNNELIYYIFDVDDNLLFMPTKVLLDKKINGEWINKDVSTFKFRNIKKDIDAWQYKEYGENDSLYKWRFRNDDINSALAYFRDCGKKGELQFLNDIKGAVKKKAFAPSWNAFIETLMNGRIFLICTARGHEPESIRKGIEYIIYHYLSESQKEKMLKNLMTWEDTNCNCFKTLVNNYLNQCQFIGVQSNYFKEKFSLDGKNIKVEDAKKIAIKYFIEYLTKEYLPMYNNPKAKVGFSDDTESTLLNVEKLMRDELSLIYPLDFYVIDTSDRSIDGGVKRKI